MSDVAIVVFWVCLDEFTKHDSMPSDSVQVMTAGMVPARIRISTPLSPVLDVETFIRTIRADVIVKTLNEVGPMPKYSIDTLRPLVALTPLVCVVLLSPLTKMLG